MILGKSKFFTGLRCGWFCISKTENGGHNGEDTFSHYLTPDEARELVKELKVYIDSAESAGR